MFPAVLPIGSDTSFGETQALLFCSIDLSTTRTPTKTVGGGYRSRPFPSMESTREDSPIVLIHQLFYTLRLCSRNAAPMPPRSRRNRPFTPPSRRFMVAERESPRESRGGA